MFSYIKEKVKGVLINLIVGIPFQGIYNPTGILHIYCITILFTSVKLGQQGIPLQCRRCDFNLWVGRIPWRRKWQPTPAFLSGKSCGQRRLVGYGP